MRRGAGAAFEALFFVVFVVSLAGAFLALARAMIAPSIVKSAKLGSWTCMFDCAVCKV